MAETMSERAHAAAARIAAAIAERPERIGFAIASIDDGEPHGELLDEVFAQASAIKIPIVWELYAQAEAGELSLSDTIPVSLASGVGGCGVLQQFEPGASQLALGDVAVLMIVLSDNVATNLLIETVGMERVNDRMKSLRLEQTRLRRVMIDLAARAAGRENTSTPREAARAMVELERRADAGEAVASRVLNTLRLRKESPVTAAMDRLDSKPRLACKPGMLDGLRTEWCTVREADTAYALTIMAEGSSDEQLKQAFELIAGIAYEAMTD